MQNKFRVMASTMSCHGNVLPSNMADFNDVTAMYSTVCVMSQPNCVCVCVCVRIPATDRLMKKGRQESCHTGLVEDERDITDNGCGM